VQRSQQGCGSAGASAWDGETVVIREFRVVLGLREEGAWFEAFSSEKAAYPFRRSETRLFAEFTSFHHPSFALPAPPPPTKPMPLGFRPAAHQAGGRKPPAAIRTEGARAGKGVYNALTAPFARGLPPNGIGFLSSTTKERSRRAGDVNPPVTVCNRAASVAAGTHRGVTGRLTSTARLIAETRLSHRAAAQWH
jgi:hypothetical protein